MLSASFTVTSEVVTLSKRSFKLSFTGPSGKASTNLLASSFFAVVVSFKPSTAAFSSGVTKPSVSTSAFLSAPALPASSAAFTASAARVSCRIVNGTSTITFSSPLLIVTGIFTSRLFSPSIQSLISGVPIRLPVSFIDNPKSPFGSSPVTITDPDLLDCTTLFRTILLPSSIGPCGACTSPARLGSFSHWANTVISSLKLEPSLTVCPTPSLSVFHPINL